MKTITFEPGKQYGTQTGCIITMKSLITIKTKDFYGQFVECEEDNLRYNVENLIEVTQDEKSYNFAPLSV